MTGGKAIASGPPSFAGRILKMTTRIHSGLATYLVLDHVTGGTPIYDPTPQEVAWAKRDPVGFAAAFFGLSTTEYEEWLKVGGSPLCAGFTKRGLPCARLVGHPFLEPKDWKAAHRIARCSAH